MSLGCFTSEYLPTPAVHKLPIRHMNNLPVANALSPQQQRIVQIVTCLCAIPQCLTCVEHEGNIQPEVYLAVLKAQKRFDVIDEGPSSLPIRSKPTNEQLVHGANQSCNLTNQL